MINCDLMLFLWECKDSSIWGNLLISYNNKETENDIIISADSLSIHLSNAYHLPYTVLITKNTLVNQIPCFPQN